MFSVYWQHRTCCDTSHSHLRPHRPIPVRGHVSVYVHDADVRTYATNSLVRPSSRCEESEERRARREREREPRGRYTRISFRCNLRCCWRVNIGYGAKAGRAINRNVIWVIRWTALPLVLRRASSRSLSLARALRGRLLSNRVGRGGRALCCCDGQKSWKVEGFAVINSSSGCFQKLFVLYLGYIHVSTYTARNIRQLLGNRAIRSYFCCLAEYRMV